MRVISGTAKSLRLKTIEGNNTRPTTDRIKETLFNMINDYMYDCVFVDLFAGSGGIGIEALSRGAKKAFFVDSSRQCAACIKDNLIHTGLKENALIICKEIISGIKEIESSGETADVIFMDPPYDNDFEKNVLDFLKSSPIVSKDTLIIVEASVGTKFEYLNDFGYETVKEKKYKTNKHVFLRKAD